MDIGTVFTQYLPAPVFFVVVFVVQLKIIRALRSHTSLLLFYGKQIEKVVKYDDHTIAVVSAYEMPELFMMVINDMSPVPRHFFHPLDKDYPRKHNWSITPNTGPYVITDFKKGKYVEFSRKENWWAKERSKNFGIGPRRVSGFALPWKGPRRTSKSSFRR